MDHLMWRIVQVWAGKVEGWWSGGILFDTNGKVGFLEQMMEHTLTATACSSFSERHNEIKKPTCTSQPCCRAPVSTHEGKIGKKRD